MQQGLYRRQVALLVRLLPAIAEEPCFALKGGTAINLFLWNDLPRLSVDIDSPVVVDGDTIKSGKFRIRLYGIDAPTLLVS
jgi:endonuclease YncB( thermonuclease family)